MKNNPLPRLDQCHETRDRLLPLCRLRPGAIWVDPVRGHRVGCVDAVNREAVLSLCEGVCPSLALHDPPYNLVAFDSRSIDEYISWCKQWIAVSADVLAKDASLYVWLGADQTDGFQPLPDFMIMMRSMPFRPRSFITLRNQRGYGTQQNWMAIRQELLYYTRGRPVFDVEAEYTAIPKVLRGYYKTVGGRRTENSQRSRSDTIRAGNVWIDIQQVFYRLHENVSGCYAQKPLAAIERIVSASTNPQAAVIDLFAHSGTTLLACERLGRVCVTSDIDPVFCEIAIRRLERFRSTGQPGWQNGNPFEREIRTNLPKQSTPSRKPGRSEELTLFEVK